MVRPICLALGFYACAADTDDVESGMGILDDSTSVDSGHEILHHAAARITVDGSREGHLVGARQMQPGLLGELWAYDVVEDGEALLVLSPPDESALADDGFGVGHAVYLMVLREDENQDGLLGVEEPIHGVAEIQLLYLDSEPALNSRFAGMYSGWNAWTPSESGENIFDSEVLNHIEIAASLAPVDSLTVSGTSDVPTKPADPIRMTAFPLEIKPVAGTWSDLIFDEVVTSQWSVTVSEPPPASHMSLLSEIGPSAMEVPVVYIDVDESGSLNLESDEIMHHICFDDAPIMLQWRAELRDLLMVLSLGSEIPSIGWSVTLSSSTHRLEENQMNQLIAESSCRMEGG